MSTSGRSAALGLLLALCQGSATAQQVNRCQRDADWCAQLCRATGDIVHRYACGQTCACARPLPHLTRLPRGNPASALGPLPAAPPEAGDTQPATFFLAQDEGRRALRYPAVSASDRSARLSLTPELTIGEATPNTVGRLHDLAVDRQGSIYAVDSEHGHVAVFNSRGDFEGILLMPETDDRPLRNPGNLVVAGDWLWLSDGRARLMRWNVGNRWRPAELVAARVPLQTIGLPTGEVLLRDRRRSTAAPGMLEVFTKFAAEAPPRELVTFSTPDETVFRNGRATLAVGAAIPQGTVDSISSTLYLTPAADYQLAALDLQGRTKWSLQVRWPRTAIDPSARAATVDRMRIEFPDATLADLSWPPPPAIHRILVDGRGRLYVFPYVGEDQRAGDRPVDVYDADGANPRHLVTPDIAWSAALDDFVYAIRPGRDGDVIVRYRLLIPPD